MVDSPEAPTTAVADTAIPSIVSESPPVASTPAASTEAAISSPVAETVASTETPVPTVAESVLGEAPKAVEAAPIEKKDAPVEAPTEFPVYEDFKLPEGVALEKEPLDAFTKILGEIETGKLDHAAMQSKGQALIDLAAKSTADSINRLNDHYVQIHNENKKARFESLKKDPELGGDKLPDTIATLQKTVGEYGGNEAQIAEFRKEVSEAGIDASPALCRLIYNMQQKINKYTTEGNGSRIVAASQPAPSKVKDYQRFYSAGSQ